ncbi:MAG: DUF4252 domain-containing protein [Cryomorphaceae bacterium]
MKKKLYTMVAILVTALSAQAQTDALTTYFSDYLNDETVTNISMSGKAFEMASGFSTESDEGDTFKRMASQINGLKMVVAQDLNNSKQLALDARKKVLNRYEDLITVTDKDVYLNLMVEESDGKVTEVFAVIGTGGELVLASITGNMLLADVANLGSEITSMSKNGFGKSDEKPIKYRVYPNPVANGNTLTLVADGDFEETEVRIYNAKGREVDNFVMSEKQLQYPTHKLGKGSFVLEFKKHNFAHTEKFIVQ